MRRDRTTQGCRIMVGPVAQNTAAQSERKRSVNVNSSFRPSEITLSPAKGRGGNHRPKKAAWSNGRVKGLDRRGYVYRI